jgi:hypothetical protein
MEKSIALMIPSSKSPYSSSQWEPPRHVVALNGRLASNGSVLKMDMAAIPQKVGGTEDIVCRDRAKDGYESF